MSLGPSYGPTWVTMTQKVRTAMAAISTAVMTA